jgi:histidine triad (HIT) family protein
VAGCSLCRLAAAKKRNYQVYEDNAILAVHDASPQVRGHLLVFPKRHVAHLEAMPGPEAIALWRGVQTVHTALVEGTKAQGSTILLNNGRMAGQEVPHVHVEVFMRREEDGGRPASIAIPQKPLVTTVEIIDVVNRVRKAMDRLGGASDAEQLRPGMGTNVRQAGF